MSQGYGYSAVSLFLDKASGLTGISDFRSRVDTKNYICQGLMEKLGAVPNGISSLLLRDENVQKEFEEEYLYMIDDRMITLAEKFNVEPRKLLSHVWEYKIIRNYQ